MTADTGDGLERNGFLSSITYEVTENGLIIPHGAVVSLSLLYRDVEILASSVNGSVLQSHVGMASQLGDNRIWFDQQERDLVRRINYGHVIVDDGVKYQLPVRFYMIDDAALSQHLLIGMCTEVNSENTIYYYVPGLCEEILNRNGL